MIKKHWFSSFVALEWAQSTLTPQNWFAHVFLMNLKKKNVPKKCKNCGFSNKSTFLGHPQILNRHSRSLETLFMKCTKILFEKCKIGVILRYHASQILIKLIQEHWFFLARTWAFLGGWRILEVGISVTSAPGDPKIFFWDIPP